jgi:hypothetical protein
MMHGREKDSAIVAGKPTNKAVPTAAESVERRAGAKGNANQQSTDRAQNRATVSQALERVRRAARLASRRHTPKVGAVCRNPARTDLGGGRSVMTVPTDLPGLSAAALVSRGTSFRWLHNEFVKLGKGVSPGTRR